VKLRLWRDPDSARAPFGQARSARRRNLCKLGEDIGGRIPCNLQTRRAAPDSLGSRGGRTVAGQRGRELLIDLR
jgi:hypothetical protein